jgi:RNA polymerase sigma factor (sigma-70 family)
MTLLDPQPRPLDEPDGCTDAELIAAVRAGDRAAYAELYRRHEGAARRTARQLTASPHDVDDLVAEAFARVYDMLSSGRGPDSAFRAYLLTAVRNGRCERARRDRRLELSEDMARHDPGVPWVDPAEAELNSVLAARAFASLPQRWRTVLWYSDVEQESTAEIGSRLGLRPNAVAALAYRAREGLRQAFLQAHVRDCDDEACRATVARLGGWTRDRLSTGDAARVDAHLASCRRCRQVAAELAEVNSGLRGLLAPLLLGGSSGASGVAVSAGGVGAAAGSGGAVSAGAVSAGAVSVGAVSGGAAVAGGSVLGWLAGAHAGQAAAVLAALVVSGTAVAVGGAVPGAGHRSPTASAIAAAQDSGAGLRSELAPIPPGRPAGIERRDAPPQPSTRAKAAAEAAKKQRTEAKAAKKATVPNPPNAAGGGPAAKPANPKAEAPGNGRTKPKSPTAAAPGNGQSTPPNPQAAANGQSTPPNPQSAAPGNGQTKSPNPEAVAAGNGQTKSPSPEAAAADNGPAEPNRANAAAPGQNKPRNVQANGPAAAVGKGKAHRASGG